MTKELYVGLIPQKIIPFLTLLLWKYLYTEVNKLMINIKGNYFCSTKTLKNMIFLFPIPHQIPILIFSNLQKNRLIAQLNMNFRFSVFKSIVRPQIIFWVYTYLIFKKFCKFIGNFIIGNFIRC